jgi:hypothetical protein
LGWIWLEILKSKTGFCFNCDWVICYKHSSIDLAITQGRRLRSRKWASTCYKESIGGLQRGLGLILEAIVARRLRKIDQDLKSTSLVWLYCILNFLHCKTSNDQFFEIKCSILFSGGKTYWKSEEEKFENSQRPYVATENIWDSEIC